MSKKNSLGGLVFSTDPNFKIEADKPEFDDISFDKQVLRIWLERGRGGKEATVIKGFVGSDDSLSDLAKILGLSACDPAKRSVNHAPTRPTKPSVPVIAREYFTTEAISSEATSPLNCAPAIPNNQQPTTRIRVMTGGTWIISETTR